MRMGLVSMILELRDSKTAEIDQDQSSRESRLASMETKPSSQSGIRTQEAISLRTFALRLDTAKRRNQRLG
ncbi:hypothetical protein EDF70_11127 [Neorhizobium sp. JUb45]|nr:hypothetical protein EDF70_11127 [Neorhizobium sp. JUb45]